MARPALPTIVGFTFITQAVNVPVKNVPRLYAIVIPAGKEALVVTPSQQVFPAHHPAEAVAQMLEYAAAQKPRWVSYGGWTIRATMGAWLHLDVFKTVLADLLTTVGILPVEPGMATVRDRSRAFARLWIRRLLGAPVLSEPNPIPEATVTAGASTAPPPAGPTALSTIGKPAPARALVVNEDAPPEEETSLGA